MKLFGKNWAAEDYMYLLSYSKLKRIITKSGIKNYIIHKNRFGGFTMDFSVTKTELT